MVRRDPAPDRGSRPTAEIFSQKRAAAFPWTPPATAVNTSGLSGTEARRTRTRRPAARDSGSSASGWTKVLTEPDRRRDDTPDPVRNATLAACAARGARDLPRAIRGNRGSRQSQPGVESQALWKLVDRFSAGRTPGRWIFPRARTFHGRRQPVLAAACAALRGRTWRPLLAPRVPGTGRATTSFGNFGHSVGLHTFPRRVAALHVAVSRSVTVTTREVVRCEQL